MTRARHRHCGRAVHRRLDRRDDPLGDNIDAHAHGRVRRRRRHRIQLPSKRREPRRRRRRDRVQRRIQRRARSSSRHAGESTIVLIGEAEFDARRGRLRARRASAATSRIRAPTSSSAPESRRCTSSSTRRATASSARFSADRSTSRRATSWSAGAAAAASTSRAERASPSRSRSTSRSGRSISTRSASDSTGRTASRGIGTVTADARLGPLYAYVEGLGLTATLVPNDNGTFGQYDIGFGLKLPTGYAVALEAAPIRGRRLSLGARQRVPRRARAEVRDVRVRRLRDPQHEATGRAARLLVCRVDLRRLRPAARLRLLPHRARRHHRHQPHGQHRGAAPGALRRRARLHPLPGRSDRERRHDPRQHGGDLPGARRPVCLRPDGAHRLQPAAADRGQARRRAGGRHAVPAAHSRRDRLTICRRAMPHSSCSRSRSSARSISAPARSLSTRRSRIRASSPGPYPATWPCAPAGHRASTTLSPSAASTRGIPAREPAGPPADVDQFRDRTIRV